MKKIVTAVALAAGLIASATAQVTISGYFGGSVDSFSLSNANATRTGNTSETRVSDQASRLLFIVNEKLSNDLTAIAQYDLRFNIDATARAQSETTSNPAANQLSGGNNHVGLASKELGTLRLGRQDIYYVDNAASLPSGLFLGANPQPVFHALATANASRTPNLVWWESKRIGGLQTTLGYSTNPSRTSTTNEVEADIGTATQTRKGGGTWARFNYQQGPLEVTYGLINFKSDYVAGTAYGTTTGAGGASANGNSDQFGQTLIAKYDVTSALKIGAGYSKERQTYTAAPTAADTAYSYVPTGLAAGDTKEATAYNVGATYKFGNSSVAASLAKRHNYKYAGVEAANTEARLTTLAYWYDFSKTTSVGAMKTVLTNGARNADGLFYQGNNAFGGQVVNMVGEKHNMISVALRQAF